MTSQIISFPSEQGRTTRTLKQNNQSCAQITVWRRNVIRKICEREILSTEISVRLKISRGYWRKSVAISLSSSRSFRSLSRGPSFSFISLVVWIPIRASCPQRCFQLGGIRPKKIDFVKKLGRPFFRLCKLFYSVVTQKFCKDRPSCDSTIDA